MASIDIHKTGIQNFSDVKKDPPSLEKGDAPNTESAPNKQHMFSMNTIAQNILYMARLRLGASDVCVCVCVCVWEGVVVAAGWRSPMEGEPIVQ